MSDVPLRTAEQWLNLLDEWLIHHIPTEAQWKDISAIEMYIQRLEVSRNPSGRFVYETNGMLSSKFYTLDAEYWVRAIKGEQGE